MFKFLSCSEKSLIHIISRNSEITPELYTGYRYPSILRDSCKVVMNGLLLIANLLFSWFFIASFLLPGVPVWFYFKWLPQVIGMKSWTRWVHVKRFQVYMFGNGFLSKCILLLYWCLKPNQHFPLFICYLIWIVIGDGSHGK